MDSDSDADPVDEVDLSVIGVVPSASPFSRLSQSLNNQDESDFAQSEDEDQIEQSNEDNESQTEQLQDLSSILAALQMQSQSADENDSADQDQVIIVEDKSSDDNQADNEADNDRHPSVNSLHGSSMEVEPVAVQTHVNAGAGAVWSPQESSAIDMALDENEALPPQSSRGNVHRSEGASLQSIDAIMQQARPQPTVALSDDFDAATTLEADQDAADKTLAHIDVAQPEQHELATKHVSEVKPDVEADSDAHARDRASYSSRLAASDYAAIIIGSLAGLLMTLFIFALCLWYARRTIRNKEINESFLQPQPQAFNQV